MSRLEHVLACLAVVCAVMVFVPSATFAANSAQQNSCVTCHSKLPASSFFGAKSHTWVGSIHQQHGVTCDKCHGGNPEAAGEKQAHAGVFGSNNPRSKVYFKNVPATCGKCHGAEYYKFTQALHYRMLESTGRGPTCVTCHGSMVTTVLTPDNLVAVCARCHNQRMGIFPYVPQKAKAVLLALRESKALLAADERLYPAQMCCTATGRILEKARVDLLNAKLDWHKFDLNTITNYLLRFYETIGKLPPAGQPAAPAGK